MHLPAIPQPSRYAGLFVIDFGEWTSVGYTADEVHALLGTPEHASARAFRINRIDEEGCIELAGWDARQLPREELIVLACDSPDDAVAVFDAIRRTLDAGPPGVALTLDRSDWPDGDRPDVVVLRFAQHASTQVCAWLSAIALPAGTLPSGGADLLPGYLATARVLTTAHMAGPDDLRPRPLDVLLRSVRQPLQR
jgi:hypothetical protein